LKGFIIILSFISVFLLTYQIIKLITGKRDYISRLNSYTNVEEAKEERKKGSRKESGKSFGVAISKGIGNAKFLDGYKKKLQVELTRAHLLLKADELITLNLMILFAVVAIVLMLKGSGGWFFTLAAGIVGWNLPMMVIKGKIKKRIKLLNEQLGDSITMMSNSLKAGYSFFQAVEIVVEEMTGPISEEFGILQKEINLGQTTEKALENMAARVSSEDLELVITAVMIQRQVGGNLAEVLDNITATIRDRVRIKGELKTVTAQGRMSGWVISLLPLILYGITYMINPQQMSLLYTRPIGVAMIVAAVFMEFIGIMLIRKVVQIEM
jgi:tight adherence protein B